MSAKNKRDRRPVNRGPAVPIADLVAFAAAADLEDVSPALADLCGPFHLLQAGGRPYSLGSLTRTTRTLAHVSRVFALALPAEKRVEVIAELQTLFVDVIAAEMDPEGPAHA